MGHSEICCILLLIFNLRLATSCGSGEYSFQALCCPVCRAGACVSKHCTSSTSTICVPCACGAFIDQPNGLEKCFKCKYCNPELGLHTLRECTETQDTVCDCKEGYTCLVKTKDGCHMCTKYISHIFNGSTNIKSMIQVDPRRHEERPTTQSGITHNDAIIKFLGQDDTRNPSMLGNKTTKKKSVSKSEIPTTFRKEGPALETTTGKPKLGRGQDPLTITITKILTTLMQTIDPAFPKESLKLQEAGNTAITELQNTTKTSLAGLQSVVQTANIRTAILSGMAGLQGAMKTGMADIQNALHTGMTGIQETLKSGMG
ncbi:tumor necrosis factor receptor superfamily member 16-like [Carcharodon carcharias]|uniref:tumor necrosis factor receptor superfamily member 16-like n=1 Tax=Carcharodon carcharias TaxID=13397 RepID=UPI001B7EB79D|nr:tumor necrosis factor receptor superfamily member 16-like [Carcharodon carcharias]